MSTRPTGKRRTPYPLLNDEEKRLLAKSPPHLEQHVLFALHTGCRAGEITTHYSAAELGTLLKWAEAIVDARPGTALRTGFAANVVELRQKRGNLPR